MADTPSLESDLRAISALNQHDVDAVLASDIDALISQWTDDFVVIPPVGPIVRGRHANVEAVRNGVEQIRAFEPVEFVSYSGKLLRILQRQPDGAWKMHRTMTTNDPTFQ